MIGRLLQPRRSHRHSRAFALIELLVVVVVLGILMAVAVPTFLRQQAKAQDSRTQQYLTTAYKAIRASTPETNNQYPQSTSMVSWVQQSEPELASASGSCIAHVQTAPVDKILIDPASTTTSLTLCARSQSGNVFKLTASNTGVQQLLDGTLVPLTLSGSEITDAVRSAGAQGDGLSSDSSTGIWEGTTNLVANGGFETNMNGWSYQYAAYGTAAVSSDRAEFGTKSLKISRTAAGSEANVWQNLTLAPSTIYTFSAWVWTADVGDAEIGTYNGSVNTPFVGNTVAGQWQRLSGTFTTTSAGGIQLRLTHRQSSTNLTSVYFDGVQVEQKSYATPYVETNGTTSVRSGGLVQAPASLLSATQGWVAARVRIGRAMSNALGSTWPRVFAWGLNGENSPRSSFDLYYDGTAGMWGAEVYNNGSPNGANSGGANSSVYTGSGSEYATLVFTWTAAQVGISLNGAGFNTAGRTVGVPASMDSTFEIGSLTASAYPIDGDILWFACGQGTLSNADAATINSWGSTDPKLSAFPSSAQTTMVWNGAGTAGSLK